MITWLENETKKRDYAVSLFSLFNSSFLFVLNYELCYMDGASATVPPDGSCGEFA